MLQLLGSLIADIGKGNLGEKETRKMHRTNRETSHEPYALKGEAGE